MNVVWIMLIVFWSPNGLRYDNTAYFITREECRLAIKAAKLQDYRHPFRVCVPSAYAEPE